MGFFGKLVKGVIDTALIPVDVVKDVEQAGEDAGDGDWI